MASSDRAPGGSPPASPPRKQQRRDDDDSDGGEGAVPSNSEMEKILEGFRSGFSNVQEQLQGVPGAFSTLWLSYTSDPADDAHRRALS